MTLALCRYRSVDCIGATRQDKAGFTPKQMFSRVDADSEFAFHQMISYAEFPPLVPPIMSNLWNESRKKAGGFMHASDTNMDIVAPILRPDIESNTLDKELYANITETLGFDPFCKDNESYMQLMCYNQIVYFELRKLAPQLVDIWI